MDKKTKKNDFSTPLVMGILNLTSNSFYDGGRFNNNKEIFQHVDKMIREGASIIDIGAESSKPGSKRISIKEELKKIKPILKKIKIQYSGILVSIDTYKSELAKECVSLGADIINDISAGDMDKDMFKTIAKLQVPYVMNHMQGEPENMQLNPQYENVTNDIIKIFKRKINILTKLNFNNIIIDPGFGFGKNLNHNYTLLNELDKFKQLNLPILVGISRKSMITKALGVTTENSLNGTTVANTIAIMKGAKILRVHDVKEAMECLKINKFLFHNS